MSARKSALLDLLIQSHVLQVEPLEGFDTGLSEQRPMPFLAIVGQNEMRMALLLSVINPAIGGVLLIGPRGIGKTTAVRSLSEILPMIEISDCDEEALPNEIEQLSAEDASFLFPDCYEKYSQGESISHFESVKIVELPLNAHLDDVIGRINERMAVQRNQIEIERGILSKADNNILYIDEVNLLPDEVVDAILDASAQGHFTVRRGAVSGTYRSRFVLIGSMNPEEGKLRPQILDRFGLRVNVRGLTNYEERMLVYQRMRQYRTNPSRFVREWEENSNMMREEIILAKEKLKNIEISEKAYQIGMHLIQNLEIDSHRADHTLFEAARAHAAADGRPEANLHDIQQVAHMALRQRKSDFMIQFYEEQYEEDLTIMNTIEKLSQDESLNE
ncbi:ATP-binding protein [Anaerolineales bacterium]